MLTQEENELICRVGPGTPMGEFTRRYWLPALLSTELPEPDCPPVRVRLLGEDLVAFRDTNGRVGLLAENCSHRRASLFYGRNEECGLRCIYHGWKYDVDGNIVDTPAEPAESMIKHHVKHTAYRCQEVNGLIVTYMGPSEKMPLLPNYEWFTLPPDHVSVSKIHLECNWLQTVEGDCDSAHAPFLHRRAGRGPRTVGNGLELAPGYAVPGFEVDVGPWWVKAAALREMPGEKKYARTNTFIPPCIGIPPVGDAVDGVLDGNAVVYQVPSDDYNTWRINVQVRRSGPIGSRGLFQEGGDRELGGGPVGREVDEKYWKIANRANDYLIDREKQRSTIYSGIGFSNNTQDACVTETMGPICDRENEHLGSGDTQIAEIRKFLLKAVRDFEAGGDPPGLAWSAEENRFGEIYSINATVPRDVPWTDVEQVRAHADRSRPYR